MATFGNAPGLALVLTLGMVCCVPARPGFAPARLTVDPAGRIDLGQLGPREVRTQGYTLGNASAAPIRPRLLDLSPGVSLAGAALERPIPGHGAARLVLRVDPAGWVGPQARNVRLETDDPGQGRYYLPVRFTVRPDLAVDGQRRSFGDVACHESPVARFHFRRETGAPLSLRLVSPLPDYLEYELRPGPARAELEFTLRPGRVPPGMVMGLEPLRVESNAPLQPRFELYLEWRMHHSIEAAPPRLVLAGPAEARLLLRSRNGLPFRILAADLRGAGFQLVGAPGPAAPEQSLAVRRTGPGPARAMLVLRCSGEEHTLEVPVICLREQAIGGAKVVPDSNP